MLKRDRSQYNRELLKKSKSEFIVQLTSSTSTKVGGTLLELLIASGEDFARVECERAS